MHEIWHNFFFKGKFSRKEMLAITSTFLELIFKTQIGVLAQVPALSATNYGDLVKSLNLRS